MSGCQMTSNQKHSREILGAKRVLVLQVIAFFQKNKQLEKQNAMEDGCEIKKPQRGRPKKKDNCNGVCRVCQTNLKIIQLYLTFPLARPTRSRARPNSPFPFQRRPRRLGLPHQLR